MICPKNYYPGCRQFWRRIGVKGGVKGSRSDLVNGEDYCVGPNLKWKILASCPARACVQRGNLSCFPRSQQSLGRWKMDCLDSSDEENRKQRRGGHVSGTKELKSGLLVTLGPLYYPPRGLVPPFVPHLSCHILGLDQERRHGHVPSFASQGILHMKVMCRRHGDAYLLSPSRFSRQVFGTSNLWENNPTEGGYITRQVTWNMNVSFNHHVW